MSHRTRVVGTITAIWLLLAIFTLVSMARLPIIAVNANGGDGRIAAYSATAAQRSRLSLAVDRFKDVGLRLPPLDVRFFENIDSCRGNHGYFSAGTSPWTIQLCSPDLDWVYEHELAHAWEHETLTDPERREFMESRGLGVWASRDVPWNERGQEWVAVVIQQGLAGAPLPPALSGDVESRLAAFESLTGRLPPVLAEWLSSRPVPCDERPTQLSFRTTDGSGLTCRSFVGVKSPGVRPFLSPEG